MHCTAVVALDDRACLFANVEVCRVLWVGCKYRKYPEHFEIPENERDDTFPAPNDYNLTDRACRVGWRQVLSRRTCVTGDRIANLAKCVNTRPII